MLCVFFWVIPRRLNFICLRFRILCLFHLHWRIATYSPMKMEQTECSETSAYTIQTSGNYPEERIQHSQHGENLFKFFISRAGKITKECFEMCNTKIKTTSSMYFCRPSWVLHLFLRDAKYVSTNLLSFLRPAKIYVKSNLLKSSIT
jgi:hypothetical protein